MDETIQAARLLRDSPSLFPWVVLVLFCSVIYHERKTIRAYFVSRIEARDDARRFSATYAELVRNNTAAMNNNTAALESVKRDRAETRQAIQHHEELSRERIDRLQEILGNIEEAANQSEKNTSILVDRK